MFGPCHSESCHSERSDRHDGRRGARMAMESPDRHASATGAFSKPLKGAR